MPEKRLEVHGDVVGSLSVRLTEAGQKTKEARATLVNGMHAQGQCWGRDDQMARAFAKEYEPGSGKVLEGAENLADYLTGMGRQIRQIGHALLTAEQDNS